MKQLPKKDDDWHRGSDKVEYAGKLDIFWSKFHQKKKKAEKKIMKKLGIELSQASLDNSKAASSVPTSVS